MNEKGIEVLEKYALWQKWLKKESEQSIYGINYPYDGGCATFCAGCSGGTVECCDTTMFCTSCGGGP